MRLTIEAGTDGGSVCCFDPAALPPDFDQRSEEDPMAAIEQLASEGKFWWRGDGDGGYLIAFYVGEEPPPEMLAGAEESDDIRRFHIPGGKLVACGVEYAASDPFKGNGLTPKGGLGRFTHMGGVVEIPAGDYGLKAWTCNWPKDAFAKRMTALFGEEGWKRQKRGVLLEKLIFLAFLIGGLAVVLATLIKPARASLGITGLLACWFLFIAFGASLPRLFSLVKSPAYAAQLKEVELQMPAFVIRLLPITS